MESNRALTFRERLSSSDTKTLQRMIRRENREIEKELPQCLYCLTQEEVRRGLHDHYKALILRYAKAFGDPGASFTLEETRKYFQIDNTLFKSIVDEIRRERREAKQMMG